MIDRGEMNKKYKRVLFSFYYNCIGHIIYGWNSQFVQENEGQFYYVVLQTQRFCLQYFGKNVY